MKPNDISLQNDHILLSEFSPSSAFVARPAAVSADKALQSSDNQFHRSVIRKTKVLILSRFLQVLLSDLDKNMDLVLSSI